MKVAEQERKGAVGEAEANKERDKAVAISEAEAAAARCRQRHKPCGGLSGIATSQPETPFPQFGSQCPGGHRRKYGESQFNSDLRITQASR